MTKEGYEIIIEEQILPFVTNYVGGCNVFQDNASIHNSILCREAYVRNQIRIVIF